MTLQDNRMKRICAWCQKDMGEVMSHTEGEYDITHGMCEDCAKQILACDRQNLHKFLDSIDVPILLLQSEPRVVTGNRRARELLGKDLPEIDDHLGGDVMGCAYASLPGGCGQQSHCESCTIRRTVLHTFRTGKGSYRVSAYPDIQIENEVKSMALLITTEKVGDAVLLRIEDLRENT